MFSRNPAARTDRAEQIAAMKLRRTQKSRRQESREWHRQTGTPGGPIEDDSEDDLPNEHRELTREISNLHKELTRMAATAPGKEAKKRPRRDIQPQQYDETPRRGKRKPRGRAHMESGKKRPHCNLKDAMVIGARTVERITKGEYEWRDAGYTKRRRVWAEKKEHEPG